MAMAHVAGARELRVAAAASLTRPMADLARLFEKTTGARLTPVLGASRTLRRQIENGAPFDLFLSADEAEPEQLDMDGSAMPGTRSVYAIGRLVIWTRNDTPKPPKAIDDLADARFAHVAIAKPELAPYGLAAKESLTKAGVWQVVEPRIVYGENVQQTLQFAESGNADVALVALAQVIGQEGRYVLVPDRLHNPIRQALVIPKSSAQPDLARRFIAMLNGREGRAILRKYGYALPPIR